MGGTVPACGGPWGPPRCPLPVLVPGLAKPRASGAHSCPQCSEGTADWAWRSEPGDAGGPSLVAPTSGGPASGSQLWEPLPLSPARRPLPPTAGATCTPPGSVRHCPAWQLPCLRATPLHADPQRLAAGTRFLPGKVGGISSLIRVEGTRSGICGKLRESAMHCQSGVVPEAVGGSGPSDRPHGPSSLCVLFTEGLSGPECGHQAPGQCQGQPFFPAHASCTTRGAGPSLPRASVRVDGPLSWPGKQGSPLRQ